MKHPRKVQNIIANPEFSKIYGEIKGEKNKRIPKMFQEKAEKIPLLYNKQFYFYKKHSTKEMLRDDLIKRTMTHRFAAKPWNMFVKKALKEFL